MANPQSRDWNHFWQKSKADDLAKPSWSKQRILRIIQPYVTEGKKVLDAGCGSGYFSRYFCDGGLQTTALDYSDSALKLTEQITANRAKIVKLDLTSGDLVRNLGDRFDIIFSDGLLEHFQANDQDKIMKNFLSLLTPSGVLVTFVPNRWSPWQLIRPFLMPGIDETPFTAKGLISLQKRNGFKVFRSGGVNTIPFALSPDRILGRYFGMLLYTVATKNE